MTIIYLEGPDGAGKTTLAQALLRLSPAAVYLHDSYYDDRPGGQFMYSTAILRQAVYEHLRGNLVVLDRGWMGDNIYHSCFRPGRQNHWPRWHHGIMERFAVLNVFCVPRNKDRFLADFNNDRLSNGKKEMYDEMGSVYDRYNGLCWGNKSDPHDDYVGLLTRTGGMLRAANAAHYDRYENSTREDINRSAADLYHQARALEALVAFRVPSVTSMDFSGVVYKDSDLIVGTPTVGKAWTVPCLSDQIVARNFADALTKASIRQDKLCLVNAQPPHGDNWILRQAMLLNPRKIIAVGEEAFAAVKKVNQKRAEVTVVPKAAIFNPAVMRSVLW